MNNHIQLHNGGSLQPRHKKGISGTVKNTILFKGIKQGIATALIVLTLASFAGCNTTKYYTYTVDETTQVLVLKESKKGVSGANTLDWFEENYKGYTIYFNTTPTPDPTKDQIDLGIVLQKDTSYIIKGDEGFFDYIKRVTEIAVNKYLENNNLDYKYIILEKGFIGPKYISNTNIHTRTVLLFFNAKNNKQPNMISQGYIEININEKNATILDACFRNANNNQLGQLEDGIEGLLSLIAASKTVNMSQDIDKTILEKVNYCASSFIDYYNYPENSDIRFIDVGTSVFYKNNHYFYKPGIKSDNYCQRLMPITFNSTMYDINSVAFIFKNGNGESLIIDFTNEVFIENSPKYDQLFTSQKQK